MSGTLKKKEIELLLRRTNERLSYIVRQSDTLFQGIKMHLAILFTKEGIRKSGSDFRSVKGVIPTRPYVMVKLKGNSEAAWLITTATPKTESTMPATLFDTKIVLLEEDENSFRNLLSSKVGDDLIEAVNHFSMPSMIYSYLDQRLRSLTP